MKIRSQIRNQRLDSIIRSEVRLHRRLQDCDQPLRHLIVTSEPPSVHSKQHLPHQSHLLQSLFGVEDPVARGYEKSCEVVEVN